MNDLIVDVKLWGESVGSLYWEKESNAALFDYERKFIRSGLDISPIIMPISQYRNTPYRFLENRTDCFKGLPGLFADSLPDTFGNQIINEWFASKGLSGEEITPLDRLCYVGKRGMGALEFEPSSPINGMNESSVLHIEELTELAKSVFTDRMAFSGPTAPGRKKHSGYTESGNICRRCQAQGHHRLQRYYRRGTLRTGKSS